jgi:SAM-dependent methyltransferase
MAAGLALAPVIKCGLDLVVLFPGAPLDLKPQPGKKYPDHYRNAHRIAFAPLTFQAARVARDRGLLGALERSSEQGLDPAEAAAAAGISLYSARVLLEACYSLDLVLLNDGRYRLSHSGFLLLHDETVRVNMDFTQDVCYQGAFDLEASLAEARPAGLKTFGAWPTIYEGLTLLPEKALSSWLAFDHFYSSGAFPAALPVVFASPTRRLLDVGGNTGKWSLLCAGHDPSVQVTLLDHPAQLVLAQAAAAAAGLAGRLAFLPMDLLDHARPFPAGFDAVWMSQFLDCFGEADIAQLLRRGREALAPGGRLYILETYWDRQATPAARDALIGTSLYFSCMANGTSRMYHSDDLRALVAAQGMTVAHDVQLGYHTLWTCLPR